MQVFHKPFLLLLLTAFLAPLAFAPALAEDAPAAAQIGEPAPDFTIPLFDRTTFHLADQKGKAVLIFVPGVPNYPNSVRGDSPLEQIYKALFHLTFDPASLVILYYGPSRETNDEHQFYRYHSSTTRSAQGIPCGMETEPFVDQTYGVDTEADATVFLIDAEGILRARIPLGDYRDETSGEQVRAQLLEMLGPDFIEPPSTASLYAWSTNLPPVELPPAVWPPPGFIPRWEVDFSDPDVLPEEDRLWTGAPWQNHVRPEYAVAISAPTATVFHLESGEILHVLRPPAHATIPNTRGKLPGLHFIRTPEGAMFIGMQDMLPGEQALLSGRSVFSSRRIIFGCPIAGPENGWEISLGFPGFSIDSFILPNPANPEEDVLAITSGMEACFIDCRGNLLLRFHLPEGTQRADFTVDDDGKLLFLWADARTATGYEVRWPTPEDEEATPVTPEANAARNARIEKLYLSGFDPGGKFPLKLYYTRSPNEGKTYFRNWDFADGKTKLLLMLPMDMPKGAEIHPLETLKAIRESHPDSADFFALGMFWTTSDEADGKAVAWSEEYQFPLYDLPRIPGHVYSEENADENRVLPFIYQMNLEDTDDMRLEGKPTWLLLGRDLRVLWRADATETSVEDIQDELRRAMDIQTFEPAHFNLFERHPFSGLPAPELEMELFDGSTFRLSEQRGKVVLIDFWDNRCGACIFDFPNLQKVADAYAGAPVVFLSLNTGGRDNDEEGARHIVATNNLTIPTGMGPDGIFQQYSLQAWPSMVIINPDGIVSGIKIGGIGGSEDQLKSCINALIAGQMLPSGVALKEKEQEYARLYLKDSDVDWEPSLWKEIWRFLPAGKERPFEGAIFLNPYAYGFRKAIAPLPSLPLLSGSRVTILDARTGSIRSQFSLPAELQNAHDAQAIPVLHLLRHPEGETLVLGLRQLIFHRGWQSFHLGSEAEYAGLDAATGAFLWRAPSALEENDRYGAHTSHPLGVSAEEDVLLLLLRGNMALMDARGNTIAKWRLDDRENQYYFQATDGKAAYTAFNDWLAAGYRLRCAGDAPTPRE